MSEKGTFAWAMEQLVLPGGRVRRCGNDAVLRVGRYGDVLCVYGRTHIPRVHPEPSTPAKDPMSGKEVV